MILDCNGELFFATHSIETYLGFHQVRTYLVNIQGHRNTDIGAGSGSFGLLDFSWAHGVGWGQVDHILT